MSYKHHKLFEKFKHAGEAVAARIAPSTHGHHHPRRSKHEMSHEEMKGMSGEHHGHHHPRRSHHEMSNEQMMGMHRGQLEDERHRHHQSMEMHKHHMERHHMRHHDTQYGHDHSHSHHARKPMRRGVLG